MMATSFWPAGEEVATWSAVAKAHARTVTWLGLHVMAGTQSLQAWQRPSALRFVSPARSLAAEEQLSLVHVDHLQRGACGCEQTSG